MPRAMLSSMQFLELAKDSPKETHEFMFMADAIPPEIASRKYIYMSKSSIDARLKQSFEKQVLFGRRRFVKLLLNDMVRNSLFELIEEDTFKITENGLKRLGTKKEPHVPRPRNIIRRVREILNDWQTKAGHDACWFYPEVFRELCNVVGLEYIEPSKVDRSDFRAHCQKFEEHLYTGKAYEENAENT